MEFDFNHPAPRAKTLEEEQEIIDLLWLALGELTKRVETQSKVIEEQSKCIEAQVRRIKVSPLLPRITLR